MGYEINPANEKFELMYKQYINNKLKCIIPVSMPRKYLTGKASNFAIFFPIRSGMRARVNVAKSERGERGTERDVYTRDNDAR